jgi:hypothetical protein
MGLLDEACADGFLYGDESNPAPCLSPFCLPDHIEMPRSASLYPKKANYRP